MREIRPILVLSNVILDDIVFADGTERAAVLGGAATYAAFGAACWWPSVAVVAGVGRDLEAISGQWFQRLGLRCEGLLTKDEHTIRNRLVYLADGQRTETPVWGAEHFARMRILPDEIPPGLLPAAATYFFSDVAAPFWESYERRRAQLGTTLWELHGAAATLHSWHAVRDRLPAVDIFSLNLSEARALLGVGSAAEIIGRLQRAGASLIVLRMGPEGAWIAGEDAQIRVRPPPGPVVDVTGAGNSFCGGFLSAWCATRNLARAARAASASAARCVATYGPPASVARAALERLAEDSSLEMPDGDS